MGFRHIAAFMVAAAPVLGAAPSGAAQPDFAAWLGGVRQEARADGVGTATLDRTLGGLQPIPRVLELDRQQPEHVLAFSQYLARVVSPPRIAAAKAQLAENRGLLGAIGRHYGVQPRFIVALWGIESDFGRSTGGFPAIGALATLAYDGRRSVFFRGELIDALKIVDHGDVEPQAMTGSWAGALGQSQFMPSTFLAYAVGWRGDRRRDIWHRRADVFASIANYLAHIGWNGSATWGRPVRLPAGFDAGLLGLDRQRPLTAWRRLGVRRSDGGALPALPLQAALVRPGGSDGPTLLVYDNFRSVLKWNNSLFFAAAVGYLADRMEGR